MARKAETQTTVLALFFRSLYNTYMLILPALVLDLGVKTVGKDKYEADFVGILPWLVLFAVLTLVDRYADHTQIDNKGAAVIR